ncbi:MAG: SUMF1/EgtB/PvdO family nonheme iron enzyme [Pseudomonadota bacterium]
MPLPSLIQTGLSTLLSDIVIKDSSKALNILKEHFRADEITKGYQDSYAYAITAITVGLAAPDQKLAFTQKIFHSKITSEFADPIEINYLQKFAQQRGIPSDALRQQLIEQLNQLIKHKDQLFQFKQFTQADLAALVNYQSTETLTQLVLAELQTLTKVDDTLAAFLSQDALLGKAMLYFFHELIRKDDRVAKTQAALQQEGLAISEQNIETAIRTAYDKFAQAAASQSTQLLEIGQQLRKLQQAQSAWQTRSQLLSELRAQFPAWRELLNHRLEQLFEKQEQEPGEVKDIKNLVEDVLAKLMARQNLSSQVKPRDEFTQHDNPSLEIIQKVALQFKQLPTTDPKYSHLSIIVGSALSSTGNLEQAKYFFRKAIEKAHNSAEKALAHFNLFQIELRRKAYQQALAELQIAIEIDPERYALHDIHKGYYPIERLLGAGGMGCVFLCKNKNRLLKQDRVIVKCFWETLKGDIDDVFKEPLAMSYIAREFVPEALDYGYANKERAYFVTEYIQGAIDGEAWLKKYGPMDLETTLEVGLQIAKGLQLAHKNGIYHSDLKPANILLKRTQTGITVKIIDFALSQVATSVGETAKNQKRLSEFGQAVIYSTLDYAVPESFTSLSEPDAKNDIFAFGATMYRLCTQKRPRPFRERDLPKVQALRDLLCDCVENERKNRPESARYLVSQLEQIMGKRQTQIQVSLQAPRKRQAEKENRPDSAWDLVSQLKEIVNRSPNFSLDIQDKSWTQAIEFEIVTVNANGKMTHRERKQARYQTEDLGKGVIMEMVYIPGGTFLVGSPETEKERRNTEGPQHKVTIEPFYMSKYPVTQAQWEALMEDNPSRFKGKNRPVERISWHEAVAFCQRLSEKTGKRYSLPTEVQWEYACRAGTTTPFHFGETITTNLANYYGNSTYGAGPKGVYRKQTTDVGSFPPNAFGLYDMHGNVWEWCADPWHESYEGVPNDGDVWEDEEKGFLAKLFEGRFSLRGGSWSNVATRMRSAYRFWRAPTDRFAHLGLRVARL